MPYIFSRERSSTGSNDCFVVLVVVLVLVFYPLVIKVKKSFCAVLWHILCLPVAHKSFCAVLWHILCRPVAHFVPSRAVAHKPKSLLVPCYGTFCAFPWHISLKVFLSKIASQELQKKSLLDSLDIFFSQLND
jgi:hypothetical protein